MPTHDTLPVASALWGFRSLRGLRRVNADATATWTDPVNGRRAFVVADGVGDDERAAAAAALAAEVAARAAVRLGPARAILAARAALLAEAPGEKDGDCVLVVAVPDTGPAGTACDVAWVGDCRAYRSTGRVLEQVTVDHTVAEFYAARRRPVTPRMAHLVTTSVRTVRPELVGASTIGLGSGRLLLCSDGVHKSMTTAELRDLLDRPTTPDRTAALLTDAALEYGGRDNATALVVDRPTPHQVPAAA